MKTKRMICIVLSVVIAMMVLPVAGYVGIVITNNCVANRIETKLVKYQLPANTTLVDSLSVAGKMVGCGNGMQYMGCLLVESDLTGEELQAHYSTEFDDIEVHLQETAYLEFIESANYSKCSFETFSPQQGKTYYAIACFNTSGNLPDILDFDIRGH